MHTQDNITYNTYGKKRKRKRAHRKKRHTHHLRLKLLFCASVFTLTLAVSAKWNLLKPQSDSWKRYSAKKTAMLTELNPDNQPQPATNSIAPEQDPRNYPQQVQPDNGPMQQEQTGSDYMQQGQLDQDYLQQEQSGSDHIQRGQLSQDYLQQEQLAKDYMQQERLYDITAEEPETTHIASVSEDWNLILVNPWNEIPDGYKISLADLPNGQSIDFRCYPALVEMMEACRAAGLHPLICSSYRTQEKQEALFQERIDELIRQGYSAGDARTKAATSVARPGTSEHQAGLAVDIVDTSYQALDASQEQTMVQQWLMENSWRYGFILRYPNNKSSLTGIIYEPWHYRYVGKEAAQEIYDRGICLEEYLAGLA